MSRQRKIDPIAAKRMRDAGTRYKIIAAHFDASCGGVAQAIARVDIPRTPRIYRHRIDRAEVRRLRDVDRLTLAQIGDRYGVSRQRVHQILKKGI